ncbi:hypothetical protein [Telluribacter sp. SYSU D00476]|uniref:hypothetical protein n=1 Tax=Telluribacter sp. SYSU D00476 TaxID=2811430 RepID=UPI001FF4FBA6|nr:hypothetical protein [Telluribacter sp. SYSU D00476]
MKSTSFIVAIAAIFALIATSASAQSKVQVDPGVSVHNYKHPNKAQKAKQLNDDRNTVEVPSIGLVERVTTARERGKVRHTPKYANRPAALAVPVGGEKEGSTINPLNSPRNYKTKPASKPSNSNTSVADLPKAGKQSQTGN